MSANSSAVTPDPHTDAVSFDTVDPRSTPTGEAGGQASGYKRKQPQTQDETNAHVAGATGILALGNVSSRVLGLAREMALTYLFGATAAVSAFQVAIIVPKAMYDLLIGGHVNGAIVPVLSEIAEHDGHDAMWHVVSILISLVVTLLLLLVLVIQVFAVPIVQLTAGGANEATLAMATMMLRITSPALIFLGLFAIASGTLFALRQFTLPAFAGVIFNGCIVVTMLLLVPPVQVMFAPGFQPDLTRPIIFDRPPDAIIVAAIGWFLGALLQMALQWVGLRHSRLRLTFRWRHPALRRIALLYAPVMFSLIMDTLVIRFFSYNLASQTGDSSIAIMGFATTLIQFPQGLVATAISIAILPTLSIQMGITRESLQAFRDTLGVGLRLATTLIIPATFGLFLLATPIVVLLFEHGAFTAADTEITVMALRLYLIGLPFAAIDLLLVYAFYARKDTLTPALIGLFSHVVYIVTVLLLVDSFGLFSLMIADSVKHITHAVISAVLLWRKIGGFGSQRFILTAAKTLVAAGVMVISGAMILPVAMSVIGTGGILREIALVVVVGGLSGLIFLLMAMLVRLQAFYWLIDLVTKRLIRK